MAKKVDRVSFRKVGDKGFIVNVSSVENEGKPNSKWWEEEEIFLDKAKMVASITKTAEKL